MGYEVVFWMMAVVWLFSLIYPWHPSWPAAKWVLHLPWLLLPMWMLYETLMPVEMNIRLDLLLIIWALAAVFIVYVVRIATFWLLGKRSAEQSHSP